MKTALIRNAALGRSVPFSAFSNCFWYAYSRVARIRIQRTETL
jgi:hypothetical protein